MSGEVRVGAAPVRIELADERLDRPDFGRRGRPSIAVRCAMSRDGRSKELTGALACRMEVRARER
jgi:hypothetical protein